MTAPVSPALSRTSAEHFLSIHCSCPSHTWSSETDWWTCLITSTIKGCSRIALLWSENIKTNHWNSFKISAFYKLPHTHIHTHKKRGGGHKKLLVTLSNLRFWLWFLCVWCGSMAFTLRARIMGQIWQTIPRLHTSLFFPFFFFLFLSRDKFMCSNSTPQGPRISPQWLSRLTWLWTSVPRWGACELVSLMSSHTMLGQHSQLTDFIGSSVYACTAVICHEHFWQNDQGLLCATAVTWGWNEYENKSTES